MCRLHLALLACLAAAVGCDRFSQSTSSARLTTPAGVPTSPAPLVTVPRVGPPANPRVEEDVPPTKPTPPTEGPVDPIKEHIKAFQGIWRGTFVSYRGTTQQGLAPSITISDTAIERNWEILRRNNLFHFQNTQGRSLYWTLSVPELNSIDLTCVDGENKGAVYPGIYKLETTENGPQMTLAFDLTGQKRPTGYTTTIQSTTLVMRFVKYKNR